MKFTIWFTALPCSGKTTICKLLKKTLNSKGIKTMHLDGDAVRTGLCSDLGFSPADRKENLRRISHLCQIFNEEDIVVLASFVSPMQKMRDMVDCNVANLKMVYVNCSVEKCTQRDVKGMYKKAIEGVIPNFTGISAPYEPPTDPDCTVFTEKETVEESIDIIMKELSL